MKITAADFIFSKYIRERAHWRCQRCGNPYPPPTQSLHCAHGVTRGGWLWRYDENNALALCYGCHRYVDQHRDEKDKLFLAHLGDKYQMILADVGRLTLKDIGETKQSIQKWARKTYTGKLKKLIDQRGEIDEPSI